MRKRSKVQRLLAIMIGAAMLAGCGSSDTQQVPQDTATEENSAVSTQESTQGTNEKSESGEQVTIQYWHQGTSQADTEFVQKCVDSFEAKYPNIKVEATGMSSTISDQETKLNAAVLSDTYPDVIQLVWRKSGPGVLWVISKSLTAI